MKYLLAPAFALAFATAALPHAGHDHGNAAAPALPAAVVPPEEALPDAEVIDQFGNDLRFRAALGTGVYVLSFTGPDCAARCDTADRALGEVATRRADFPEPLRLLTLTVDPARDQPEALLARHRDLGGADDWLWLTGDPAEILPLLAQLGAAPDAASADQPAFVIVGHAGRQQMTRLEVTPRLAEQVHDLVLKLAREDGD